jgi:hypothetical protein
LSRKAAARLLLFGSPVLAAAITGAALFLGTNVNLVSTSRRFNSEEVILCSNMALAAFGSGASGLMTQGSTGHRVFCALGAAIFGALVYGAILGTCALVTITVVWYGVAAIAGPVLFIQEFLKAARIHLPGARSLNSSPFVF